MKAAFLLLVLCVSAAMAVEAEPHAALARKLLDKKDITYCDGKHDDYSCTDYEYCADLGYSKCYPKQKCDDYCKRHDYKYEGHGYDKKKVKYCAEYGKNCYTEQKCDDYCKRHDYKYEGHGYDKKKVKYCAEYGKHCYDVQECKYHFCKSKKHHG
ncbi:unnamed protein product [Ostreobium quekettii]|uniref:Uncharacterized protein n=1 Tax=Ostreobium quekettii TaxID=121088 RepID=A0A8S1J5N2_9CHLO|nr:unnamed protein product [Ostreobium quekettii]